MMNRLKPTLIALLLIAAIATASASGDWKDTLRRELPLLGHRNWIVVADSAYPLQIAPGIETICAGTDQLTVVKQVLADLAATKHVQPTVYTDAELNYVPEKNATGVTAYRDALANILGSKPIQVLPHEQIIGKLDEAGKTFKVLLIKSTMTIPYTSVFFQLSCGYWNDNSEHELRDAMSTGSPR